MITETPQHIAEQIRRLPEKPGVYQYFDARGKILYIGKAKSLKKRVSSYFTAKAGHSGRTRVMVGKINEIRFTLVNNEFEALLLENSLIKKHQPRYNVNLRDDKTYPFICIKNERFPRVFPTRNRINDGSEYYGPFASVTRMNIILDLAKVLFPLRTCSFLLSRENVEAGKFRVCLDHHIGLCMGPCEGLQGEQEYNDNIESIRQILRGNSTLVMRTLKEKMEESAAALAFEEAEQYRQKLEKLEHFHSKSTVANVKMNNVDVFAIQSDEKVAVVSFLKVANGTVVATDTLEYRKKLEETHSDILLLAIAEIREKYNSTATEIIVPEKPEADLEGINFIVPQRGDKRQVLDLANKNAWFHFKEHLRKRDQQQNIKPFERILGKLKEDLKLPKVPYHIECFDNSNIQGTTPVASMVVFKNGKPAKKLYRHYNIKTVVGPNDYASMEEVVYRRYRRLLDEQQTLPQLILIDGGKGQLSAAVKSLQKLDLLGKTSVRAIAKKLEDIFMPGDPLPLSIDKKSEGLRILQQLRNEAHRFAITFHREKRLKKDLGSSLEKIEGIGQKTSQKLLMHFRSVKKIVSASEAEIAQVVGPAKAKVVRQALDAI